MFSDRVRSRLGDIVENADAIVEYMQGLDFASFAKSRITIDAVERCLHRISEAVIQIGPDTIRLVDPTISSVQLRGLGNFLRHEYFRVDLGTIYQSALDDVPGLRTAAAKALEA